MNPQAEGTLISDLQDDNIIKAIAAKDNIFYVKFESKHNLCPYQFISKILIPLPNTERRFVCWFHPIRMYPSP